MQLTESQSYAHTPNAVSAVLLSLDFAQHKVLGRLVQASEGRFSGPRLRKDRLDLSLVPLVPPMHDQVTLRCSAVLSFSYLGSLSCAVNDWINLVACLLKERQSAICLVLQACHCLGVSLQQAGHCLTA